MQQITDYAKFHYTNNRFWRVLSESELWYKIPFQNVYIILLELRGNIGFVSFETTWARKAVNIFVRHHLLLVCFTIVRRLKRMLYCKVLTDGVVKCAEIFFLRPAECFRKGKNLLRSEYDGFSSFHRKE